MMIRYSIGFVILFICSTICVAQGRIKQSINTGWKFYKGDIELPVADQAIKWESVSIPHSYNSTDVMDDEPGYYRGNTWYSKTLFIPADWKKKNLYLYFEGVNQVATVYVNGKLAGQHIGGYTAFRIPINEFLNNTDAPDEVLVKVNNEFNPDIPPLTADFTFFGGIYRDVFLEVMNPIHFASLGQASESVFITTPSVNTENASIKVNGAIENASATDQSLQIITKVFSPEQKLVATQQSNLKLRSRRKQSFAHSSLRVTKPMLWSPESPMLYRVVTIILDSKSKKVVDEISAPLGFRWFSFTGDKGFLLNGKPYKIWGTSRHQDYPGLGNALPDVQHVNDVKLLKEMGGNFLRVAHYPQDPAILEACDRLGILASVEIPVVNAITESEQFTRNSEMMLREMIQQNFNHPSVIMWASMNEVLLRPPFNDDKPRQEVYFKNVNKLARRLDSLIRVIDPTRVTMAAFHGNYSLYKRTGLIDIPMVAGWNLYQGWYSDNVHGFATFLDDFHKDYPNTPLLVTEYGADGDPRVHSFSPVRFDKSIEYETYYHQVYYKAMVERPFVSGGLIWNLCDFSSETRAESMPHVNNKGIVDLARTPKDAYYFYQSRLAQKPYLRIASKNWKLRSGTAINDDSLWCPQTVDVFTNSENAVQLFNNGKLLASGRPVEGVVSFKVPFTDGLNAIEAVSGELKDFCEITFDLQPKKLNSKKLPFESINISLGDPRYIVTERNEVWLPEQEYTKGSWGYIGGRPFILENKRQPFGSDKNILGTDNDPMYETQRVGIEYFKLDVPDGQYEITFHFAELTGGAKKEALVYNLAGNESIAATTTGNRSFNILVNNTIVASNLGNKNYLVPEVAYNFKTSSIVSGGEGLMIKFDPLEGEAILNGLQVRRIY